MLQNNATTQFIQGYLPKEIQDDIMKTLKCYECVHITYSNGSYHVSPNIGISAQYAPDSRYIRVIHDNEVYTPEEIENNFEEVFGYRRRFQRATR